jgi:hypothetical protein
LKHYVKNGADYLATKTDTSKDDDDDDENEDDWVMFFDAQDNYVSPETMCKRYKQIFNSLEYKSAVKSLLEK